MSALDRLVPRLVAIALVAEVLLLCRSCMP